MKIAVRDAVSRLGDMVNDVKGKSENFDILQVDTLLTDSRSLISADNAMFVAIRTKSNDGHRYIPDLYDKGVRAYVVEDIPADAERFSEAVFIRVADTLEALRRLGRRRQDYYGEVVGITGSRGKTTLKEWIFQLMEPYSTISRSPRSYNSQIGVPLSMWEIADDADMALIEAGISRKGEMERLSECINADTVIITNIGDAHAEGFADMEAKAKEKALLIGEKTKTVIYNGDSELVVKAVAERAGSSDVTLLRWSLKDSNAPLFIKNVEEVEGGRRITYVYGGRENTLEAPVTDEAEFENALNALAFMLHRGVDAASIADSFRRLHKIGTRLNVTEGVAGCSVILDSYTSDFSSLLPAIDFMKRRAIPGQRPVLIMSDLHHEGGDKGEVYARIASLLRLTGIYRFIGVGPSFVNHARLFPDDSRFYSTTAELLEDMPGLDFRNEIVLVKGSPEYNFSSVAEMLDARKHETVLEVNLDAIVNNYNYFRSFLPPTTGIICMVKAFGYGAGSYEIAKTLQDCGAAYLAVAVLDEGIDLRRRGITMPILVMNPKVANYKAMIDYSLEPNIYSLDMLSDVIAATEKFGVKNYPIHIKLDTGMHRTGFVAEELDRLVDMVNASGAVEIKSVFSHLATADCIDMDQYTERQLDRFAEYTDRMLSRTGKQFMRHILNSAGILRYADRHHYDMARLGIGLYGANTLPADVERPLDTVSSLKTVIISLREWKAGEAVGYSRKGLLARDSMIATIPIGYADGMNRHFGCGNISVKVNGCDAPTVGNICMDNCMIDVTGIDCKVGDQVEIFGKEAPIYRLSDLLGTIPYEVLTSVSPRVKRVYFRE